MSTEEKKAIVHRYVEEVLNDRILDVVDELFDSDCILHDPNLGEERQGSDVIEAHARISHVVSPDYNVHVEETVAEGESVIISWTANGTLAPEMGDPGPTGDEVTVSGISMFRFNDEGRISYMKQLSRSLDDYPKPVPKDEAARERLLDDPVSGRLGEAAFWPKCWFKPWTCHWDEPDDQV